MSVICKEHAESRCDCYPHLCYGCNAFANPTNFDRIKRKIFDMTMDELIDFCGGDSCDNVICGQISNEYAHCRPNKTSYDCGVCIREYLKRKPE